MAMTQLDIQALNILKQAGQPIDDATCCLGHALEAIKAAVTQAPPGMVLVDRGALQMAINVLRRAGKDEVANELAASPEYKEGE